MSNVKSEVIIGTVTSLGSKFEDLLEAVRLDIAKLEGMKTAVAQLTKTIERQYAVADSESDAGKFDLETKDHVKRHITQCLNSVKNAASQIDANIQMSKGKQAALEVVVKEAERLVQSEQTKMRSREMAVTGDSGEFDGPAYRRPAGVRPSDPLASRRAEQVAAESVAEEAVDATDAVEVAEETPKAEA